MCLSSLVQCTHALLQREQALVNLSTFYSPVAVIALDVLRSLRAREVNKMQLSYDTFSLAHCYLTDSV